MPLCKHAVSNTKAHKQCSTHRLHRCLCRTLSKTRLLAYIGAMQQRVNQILEEAKMMGSRGEAWYNQRMKEMEEVGKSLRGAGGGTGGRGLQPRSE